MLKRKNVFRSFRDSAPAKFSVDQLLDGPRPGLDDLDADRQWCRDRGALDQLAAGGPYDIRKILDVEGAARRRWLDERRAWLLARW